MFDSLAILKIGIANIGHQHFALLHPTDINKRRGNGSIATSEYSGIDRPYPLAGIDRPYP
jgi:hypothetical protein